MGITRKAKKNSTVIVKATADDTVSLPYTTYAGSLIIEDSAGVQWINTTDLVIAEFKPDGVTRNNIGTATFAANGGSTDLTSIVLAPYSTLTLVSGSAAGITFVNEVQSVLGNEEESDAQLRARYKNSLYKSSVGTVSGLESAIKNNSNVTYVNILENDTNTLDERGLPPHSIWVIVDGNSESETSESTHPDDISVANAILNYKSLGCSTTYAKDTYTPYDAEQKTGGTGAISVNITENSTEYVIQFSRANKIPCYVTVDLSSNITNQDQKDSIAYVIKQNIIGYVNNLGIANDVLQSGLSCAVYDVIETNDYVDYVFDINSITAGRTASPTDKRITIDVNEYANITAETITITWEA